MSLLSELRDLSRNKPPKWWIHFFPRLILLLLFLPLASFEYALDRDRRWLGEVPCKKKVSWLIFQFVGSSLIFITYYGLITGIAVFLIILARSI